MKRPRFFKTVGGAAVSGVSAGFAGAVEEGSIDVGSLFESDDPEVLALAKRVMEKCVLAKIMPPPPPFLTGNCFSGRPRPDHHWAAQGSGGRGFGSAATGPPLGGSGIGREGVR